MYKQNNYLEAEQEFQKAISVAQEKKQQHYQEGLQLDDQQRDVKPGQESEHSGIKAEKEGNQVYEKGHAAADREKDLNEKLSKIKQSHEKDLKSEREKQKILYEQKLAEKYQQFYEALREKEELYNRQIIDRDEEIKAFRAQAGENEETLRQLIAKKDLEYNVAIEEQKNIFGAQVRVLKQSLGQLKIYLTKLKEELKLQETALAEKDNHIALLTKKLALYSGEEFADEKKVSAVIKEELANLKRENERLTRELEMRRQRLAEEQNSYKEKLAQQQQIFEDMQQASAAKLSRETSAGEKKMQLIEEKYSKQIRELEQQNEKMKEEFEVKLKDFAEKSRNKAAEDEQFTILFLY
ncbi:MAG: hypothetical protein L6416_12830 [Candidatus Omnitrophica bacterium]|nr:hypothetical protein [Candidatus Omnitrophota bacterium]